MIRAVNPHLVAGLLVLCGVLSACSRVERDKSVDAGALAAESGEAAARLPVRTEPLVDLAELHADAPDIDWFAGDVDAAFASASAANKPVFLYWGAQWCPPCKQLKTSVFARPDFIAKSKSFVNIYLDGDLPKAQEWGDRFRVTGYPTVVILRGDRTEITRVSGGMDLSLYAAVLDNALGDVRPVKEVLELAANQKDALSANDCRRLAYHAFGLEDGEVFPTEVLARGFESAALRCPESLAAERARLTILAAQRVTGLETEALKQGSAPSARLKVLVAKVTELLKATDAALANADALRGLGETFFKAARRGTPEIAADLRSRWMAVADAAAKDARFALADQLAAQQLKINAAKGFAPDGKPPTDVSRVALAAADAMLAENRDPYVRASIVNSAINIYLALDDKVRARDLLAAEAATSKHPHYYLGDLADVEEKLGNRDRAVELLAAAYHQAKGPASRFQWGFNYVSGLVRMRPDDLAQIERAGLTVLAELAAPGSVHRRSRARLDRLQAQLKEWATSPQRAAVVNKLQQRFDAACAASESAALEQTACKQMWTI
jgi:thiol-disulfide isomerase/thioredoxin